MDMTQSLEETDIMINHVPFLVLISVTTGGDLVSR